jgi:hypothetical protein
VTYEVTLGDASATADNLHDALAVAAELVAQLIAGARSHLVITCDGELDEGATELAREGLRPVRPGHGPRSHLGEPGQTP